MPPPDSGLLEAPQRTAPSPGPSARIVPPDPGPEVPPPDPEPTRPGQDPDVPGPNPLTDPVRPEPDREDPDPPRIEHSVFARARTGARPLDGRRGRGRGPSAMKTYPAIAVANRSRRRGVTLRQRQG